MKERQKVGPSEMAFFPWKEDAAVSPGSLIQEDEFYHPSAEGNREYVQEDAKTTKAGRKPTG